MDEYDTYENFEKNTDTDFVAAGRKFVSDSEALRWGRLLRMGLIQGLFNDGELAEVEARKLLKGNLTPDDDSTFIDDSDQLVTDMKRGDS